MKPLLAGVSDTLNILAFKWRGIRTWKTKLFLLIGLAFIVLMILGSAWVGAFLRIVISTPAQTGIVEMQNSLILGLNIFLTGGNADIAAGGIFWALLGSIIVIPLVGYSFASIIPEGDLVSIKKTDNHKIADSILLQFTNTISFVQIMMLTALTSVFTLASEKPGLGIVFVWGIWVISVLLTVIAVWSFEFLYRKFGVKSKLFVFLGLLITVGLLWLIFPTEFPKAFGIGSSYVAYVQYLNMNTLPAFFLGLMGIAGVIVLLGFVISFVASNTLKVTERPKKNNYNKVFIARLGLQDKNKINTLTEFLANMVIRQNNIWKPIALSAGFMLGLSIIFYNFYNVLLTISALLPVMISLVWSINIFGIIGSGTSWLVSLPKLKKQILASVAKIQYVIILAIAFLVMVLVFFIHHETWVNMCAFLFATCTATVAVTQFSLRKAVYHPTRYRVHIRGESVLPPDKAFLYMLQLFLLAFAVCGASYLLLSFVTNLTSSASLGLLAQLGGLLIVSGFVYIRYQVLKQNWIADPEILQNIIKTVGQN